MVLATWLHITIGDTHTENTFSEMVDTEIINVVSVVGA